MRYRLYEIDRLINRTLVYVTLTAGLAATFAAVSLTLGVAIGSGSTLPTAVGTLAVALVFGPLRSRVQRLVDRRFDRARYEGLRQGRALPGGSPSRPRRAGGDGRGDGRGASAIRASSCSSGCPPSEVHVDASGRVVDELPAAGRAHTPVRRGELQLATVVHDTSAGRASRSARERRSRPPGWRSRSPACASRYGAGWPRWRSHGRGSSPPATRSGAGWSETSTTAPSSGWSRSGSRCATSRGGSPRRAARRMSSTPPSTRSRRRDRGAARAGPRRPAGRPRRRTGDGAARARVAVAAARSGSTATEERFEDRLETAAYFVASEALTNAAKHAHASEVTVSAGRRERQPRRLHPRRRHRRRRPVRAAPGWPA